MSTPGTDINKVTKKELPQTDVYDILTNICNHDTDVRLKYSNMASVFYYLTDEYTRSADIVFANLLARVDHLLKTNRPSGKGEQMADYSTFTRDVHNLRYRLSHIDNFSDEELAKFAPYDFRTLCKWTENLTLTPIPVEIKKHLPLDNLPEVTSPVKSGYYRMVVDDISDNILCGRIVSQNMLPAKVLLKYSETGEEIDFTYLKPVLQSGCQVNIIRPRTNSDGLTIADLIIYEPDYLIDITATASCFESYGVTPLSYLISRLSPDDVTQPILLGNFAGQLLDEAIHSTEPVPYATSAKTFFRNYVSNLVACGSIDSSFHTQAKAQAANISKAVNSLLKDIPAYNKNELLLEPSFFCEMLGLQGRMDMLQADMSILVEQKSGKAAWGSDEYRLICERKHYIQILLYQALLHYGFGINNGAINSFLLYSKYPNPLLRISNSPKELREAFKIRNLIAAQEIKLGNDGFDILLSLTPDDLLKNESKQRFFDTYKRPGIAAVLDAVQYADKTAQAYALTMLKFVQIEHLTAKTGFSSIKPTTGFASAWNTPTSEKRAAGDIIEELTIKGYKTDEISGAVTHVILSVNDTNDDVLPNFRTGDIVAMYYYVKGDNPDVRRSVVIRADLESLGKKEITLKLRAPQGDKRIFKTDKRFRVAIERDLYDSSYKSMYQGIIALLNTDDKRRQLILAQRKPSVDNSAKLTGCYGSFNDLVLKSKRAKDLFIIIGPPGTGKTSHALLNIVKEELTATGTKLLLVAFTNRAVDEICAKLSGADIDFVRIGSHLNCAKDWQPFLLKEAIKDCATLQSITDFIDNKKVIVGTLQSINGSLAMLKRFHFTTAVIDEASQILEPHILPLLSSQCDNKNLVDRFIFIGDHKQLPAIVTQPKEKSVVTNPLLNKTGLYDCRDSFFHRMLLNAYDQNNMQYDESIVYSLNNQGRMHKDTAIFASEMFYDGKLKPVPLKHQLSDIPQAPESNHIDHLLNTSRMILCDVRPSEDDLQKVDNANKAEAAKVAEIIEAIIRRTGDSFNPAKTIGVIVPYRSQIITIRKALEPFGDKRLDDIVIDTVERFQGSQRQYIIYCTTVKRLSQLNFLTDNRFEDNGTLIDRKLNVALTRTQSHTIIVCNKRLICRDPIYKQLCNICSE